MNRGAPRKLLWRLVWRLVWRMQPPPTDMRDDAIERGLAEAFGEAARARPSVLRTLQARTSARLGVHLDSQGPPDAPVRVTEEARALRDPSGRYQVLGEIGRGGVGIVYKGRDHDLGRDVAMKVLRDEYAEQPDVLARFVEEAQIGGQLQHPGIVPVYELGLQAGERPYFAMKLVKGETLAEQLARRSSPAADRRRLLGIFEQVCQTLAYAHARRVVHRDLKPANVMIGAFGEVQVVDWGFAKVLAKGGVADERASLERASLERVSERSVIETVRSEPGSAGRSVPGSMMGTPAYMPPEQARGEIDQLDRRSDVFGLGAILCEILTGEPPYREADGDLVRQAAGAALDGAHERLERSGADRALIELCTECLAPARRARPESAAEVAERVSAWLTSVEERARRAELDAAQARYRHRSTLVAAAAALVLVLAGAGAWIWTQGEAQARRAQAAQRVATALSAASGARGRAQAAGLEATPWDAALASAQQAAELASSDDVDEETRARARALVAAVAGERDAARAEAERVARDEAMLARLVEARIPRDENARDSSWRERESRRLGAAYADAFDWYVGTPFLDAPSDEALTAMRRSDFPVELATSLDHWALVRDGLAATSAPADPAGTERIRELAVRLDPDDPWRAELRARLPDAENERARLLELAAEADLAALTAAGCRVLGDALWRAGEPDAAQAVLARAQEQFPQDFDLCFRLALQYELQNEPRWDDAIATYRIAHALRPDHLETLHRIACCHDRTQHHEEAERIFLRLAKLDPQTGHWPRDAGNSLRDRGRFEEAFELLRRAVELDPDDANTRRDLGYAQFRLGRSEDAAASYRRAQDILRSREDAGPLVRASDAHTWLTTAYGWHELERWDEALAATRRALELDPLEMGVPGYLADLLVQTGDGAGAIESLQDALRRAPDRLPLLAKLGMLLLRFDRPHEAEECFRRMVELDPELAGMHNNLGLALLLQGERDEAFACFLRALEIDAELSTARVNVARAALRSRSVDEGTAVLLDALDLDEAGSREWNDLGIALQGDGRLDEAIEVFRRGIAADPDHASFYVNLGNAHRDRGDVAAAREAFERAVELFEAEEGEFAEHWRAFARRELEKL